MENKKKVVSSIDYSKYLFSTPKDGGEYYGLSIPKDVTPPVEGVQLNVGGIDLVVFSVCTPEDIAKGRGGTIADSMLQNGIGWRVKCLPPKHEYIRRAGMYKAIESLDAAADALEAMGMVKEALHLDKVADRWEEFLETQKAGPGTTGTKGMFPSVQIKKFLWGSGDKRLQTVKDVLENIVRRRKGLEIPQEKLVEVEDVLKDLRKASITEFTSQSDIDKVKKQIHDKILNINPNLAELIGLLFVTPSNKMERMHNENEINRIAKPYLIPNRSNILNSDVGRSNAFYEMSRRANSLDLSGLSEKHIRIVNACLDAVMSKMVIIANTMEKRASLNNYLTQLISYMQLKKRDAKEIAEKINKGLESWPLPPNIDRNRVKIVAWKKAITSIARSPEEIKKLILSLKLNSKELKELIMPIEELAGMANESIVPFIAMIDRNASASNSQPPLSDDGNPVVINKSIP